MTESPPPSTPPPPTDESGQSGQAAQSGETGQTGQTGSSGNSTLSEFRRLRRAKAGRVIGGVCAGLGRDLRMDPVILRVVLAVMVFFGGVGLLIYGAAWLLIPEEGEDERSILERQLGRRPNGQPDKAVVIGGVVVLFLLIASVPWWGFSWHPAALLLLAGAGLYFLLRRAGGSQPSDGYGPPTGPPNGSSDGIASWLGDQRAAAGPAAGGPAGPGSGPAPMAGMPGVPGMGATAAGPAPAGPMGPSGPMGPMGPEPATTGSWRDFRPLPAEFWHQPDPLGLESEQAPPPGQPMRPVMYGPPPPPAPRPPRSKLFWVTSAFALIVLGAMAAIDQAAGTTVPAAAYVAAPLAVVGLGLIAGAWWGRSPGLVVSGVLLSLALAPASFGDYLDEVGAGTLVRRPASVQEIAASYDYGAGKFVLDLRNVTFSSADDVTTTIDCGACELQVLLPENVDVNIAADLGVGDMQLFPKTEPARAPESESSGSQDEELPARPAQPERPEPADPVDLSGRPQGPDLDGIDDQVHTSDYGVDGPGGGTLNLNVDLGVGNLEVRRG